MHSKAFRSKGWVKWVNDSWKTLGGIFLIIVCELAIEFSDNSFDFLWSERGLLSLDIFLQFKLNFYILFLKIFIRIIIFVLNDLEDRFCFDYDLQDTIHITGISDVSNTNLRIIIILWDVLHLIFIIILTMIFNQFNDDNRNDS